MTATQSQIRDAKDALYLLYSAAVESEYRTYGDPDEHYAVVSTILQSALDTQKPAGDGALVRAKFDVKAAYDAGYEEGANAALTADNAKRGE